ncbi:MAG: O-antigen ligase family protein, partial [Sulfuriferula sp.]
MSSSILRQIVGVAALPKRLFFVWTSLLLSAAAITLFLAPTKEWHGLALMTLGFVLLRVSDTPKIPTNWRLALRVYSPLWVILVIGFLFVFFGADLIEFLVFTREFVIGFLCYLAAYWLMKNFHRELGEKGLMLLLLLPGMVHLSIFSLDLVQAFTRGELDTPRYFQHLKDIPRVGRKYLSIALTSLLVFALLGSTCVSKRAKTFLLFLFPLSVFALAILDTRSAELSLVITVIGVIFIPWLRKAFMGAAMRITTHSNLLFVYLASVLAFSILIAFSAGQERWSEFSYSVAAVFQKTTNAKAWQSIKYWQDTNCGDGREFRCSVDQSAYLRLSWLQFGLQGVLEHPLGIGATRYTILTLLDAANPSAVTGNTFVKESHSGFLDLAICFGLPGAICFVWFCLKVLKLGRNEFKNSSSSAMFVGIYLVFCISLVRFLVDNMSDGLWYYLMSMAGMLVAMSDPYDKPMSELNLIPNPIHKDG